MATTNSTPLMTWEAFERLPDGDGFHRELIEGELQVLPPAKLGHSKIAKRCLRQFLPLEDRGLGEVFPEAGYKLGDAPPTWIQPDVSFVLSPRPRDTEDANYMVGAPDLAIEVVSPSESASDLHRKILLLFRHECRAVWAVYPRTKTVQVHLPDGKSYKRTIGEILDAPFLLEGWSFPVAKLFED